MNLIVDIGNTRIKTALFDRQNQLIVYRNFDKKESLSGISNIIESALPEFAIISEVGGAIHGLEKLLETHKIKFFHINHHLKLPFQIDYKTPETLGADRLALVAGAFMKKPVGNRLIIDAGTCITYDFLGKDNIYRGGAISPGINLRFKSLNDYTNKLPLLTDESVFNLELIGKSTKTSIESGVINGVVFELEGFIREYQLKYKDLTIFLTGGSQKLLDRYIKNMIFVNSNFLLLEGMNYILNLNK